MLNTKKLLQKLSVYDIETGGTGSDYAISKLLNSRQQTISGYRTDSRIMADEIGLKAASILDLEGEEVILNLTYERIQRTRDELMIQAMKNALDHYYDMVKAAKKAA